MVISVIIKITNKFCSSLICSTRATLRKSSIKKSILRAIHIPLDTIQSLLMDNPGLLACLISLFLMVFYLPSPQSASAFWTWEDPAYDVDFVYDFGGNYQNPQDDRFINKN